MSMAPKPFKASILGANLDVGNRGVRALGVSLAGLLARIAPEATLSYHYGAQEGGPRALPGLPESVEVHVRNHRMAVRSRPGEHLILILLLACAARLGLRQLARRSRWLAAILDADLIGEIRGGDSFSDIYGFRRFLLGSLPLLAVAVCGKPYVMLPQTYGPFKLASSRMVARVLLRRASMLFTRDRQCAALVEDLCGRTPQFCPDVAFTLEPRPPAVGSAAHACLANRPGRVLVGVNVSGLLYMGGYTRRNMFGLRDEYRDVVDALVGALLRDDRVDVMIVPHVFGSEEEEDACASLSAKFGSAHPGRVAAITEPLSEQELKWIIGRTDFFVGARMHACIAALSQGVPAIGLAYSDKFAGVFDSAGVGSAVVDLRQLGADEAVAQVLAALERRDELSRALSQQVPKIVAAVDGTFRKLMATRGDGWQVADRVRQVGAASSSA